MALPADPSKLQFGAYSPASFEEPMDYRNNGWQLSDETQQQSGLEDLPVYFDIYQ